MGPGLRRGHGFLNDKTTLAEVTVVERNEATLYEPVAAPASASALLRWYVLAMMMMVYTISIADRYVISIVLEPIRLELQLSDAGVAFLTGVSLTLFYVSFGIPLSVLADKVSRRNIITVSVILWSGLTVLTGLTRNYWQFLLARIGVGIGEAGGTPAANSIISDYFPVDRRPMALTIFSLGAPLGSWVALDLAGYLSHNYGWRSVFFAFGVPGVIFGVLLFLTVREPRRGQLDRTAKAVKPSIMETLRFLFSQRSAVHMMVAGAITCLWGWGMVFWIPAYLQRAFLLNEEEVGSITGPIHLFAGAGATLATSWFLGLSIMAHPKRVAWLLGIVVGLSTIPTLILVWTSSLAVAKLMMWLFIPAIYFYIGPSFGVLNNLAPPHMRAQFCAITLLVANIGNLIIAPLMVGKLSDVIGAWFEVDNAVSLRWALLFLAPMGFWATWHYFTATRTIERDQTRATGAAP